MSKAVDTDDGNHKRSLRAVAQCDTPGRLIVLEGPDGVGKSTIATKIATALRLTRPCELLSFPGRDVGTLGHLVYKVHHDSANLRIDKITPAALQALHIAAHLDSIARRIVPALCSGTDVVLDRYWWSTFVYGAVAGLDRTLLTTLIEVERQAWNEYKPHLAILLRRDAPIGRDNEDRTRWLALRSEYDALAERERGSHRVIVSEDAPSVDAVRDQVLAELEPSATPVGNSPPQGVKSRTLEAAFDVPPESQPTNQQGSGRRRNERKLTSHADQIAMPVAVEALPTGISVRARSTAGRALAPSTSVPSPHLFVKHLAPAEVTAVYETYWRFAAERQHVFFRRLHGALAPWTDDPILATYKFTNTYRAADRVSQYLIRNVIYRDDLPSTPQEVCFRILLFKFFNKIQTWQLLEQELGPVTWEGFRLVAYDRVLTAAMAQSHRIYSAAYIMPPGSRAFGYPAKHRNHLALLELMMTDGLPDRLEAARTMQQGFELLLAYPTIGDFLAYQFVTDINYSDVTHFSEMEFVVPGPGALSGIRKCFANTGGLNEPEIIRFVTEMQEDAFTRLGLDFQSLWGRPLQLIDCQNIFCEVDKYARVRHPDIEGRAGRTQIKQKYVSSGGAISYWFPPKWHLNVRINEERAKCGLPVSTALDLLADAELNG